MPLLQLDNLVRIRKLKAEPPAKAEFEGLLRSGKARLDDAGNKTLSPESRFDLAYNAAHALSLAALRFRPQSGSKVEPNAGRVAELAKGLTVTSSLQMQDKTFDVIWTLYFLDRKGETAFCGNTEAAGFETILVRPQRPGGNSAGV